MKYLIAALLLVSINAQASVTSQEECKAQGKGYVMATFTVKGFRKGHCRKPRMPKCSVNTESCRNSWMKYGDLTGDYGIVDAAE